MRRISCIMTSDGEEFEYFEEAAKYEATLPQADIRMWDANGIIIGNFEDLCYRLECTEEGAEILEEEYGRRCVMPWDNDDDGPHAGVWIWDEDLNWIELA